MIVGYNTNTFDITFVQLSNANEQLPIPDNPTEADQLAALQGAAVAPNAYFIAPDDDLVATRTEEYWVEEILGVPTNINLKNLIDVQSSIDPMDLNDQPVFTIQLTDPSGTPISVAGVVVSLEVNSGIISAASITTNGSGNGTVTYKPPKTVGTVTMMARADKYRPFSWAMAVNIPTDSSKQQWLETDDIKDDSITTQKQSKKAGMRAPGLHNFWFIDRAFQVQIFDVNAGGPNNDQNINSIVVDDLGFFYVNCFDGLAATNPVVKRLNKNTGALDWSVALTHDNLANRFDGMCFDGTYIWVACANYIRRVNVLNSADTTEYQMATDPQGGDVQAMAFDGEFIWLHLRGGTNPNADKIWKVNPTTGAAVGYIDYRTADPIGSGVRDIKEFAMDDEFLYFAAVTPGVTVSDWTRIKRSDGTMVFRNEGDLWGSYGIAIDVLSHHIWTAGGQPGGAQQINLDTTDTTPRTVALNWGIAQWYDLLFDGKNCWGISTVDTVTATRRFVRKMTHNVVAATLDQVQAFDFDNIAVGLDPTDIAFDGQYIYVANFANTVNSVVKIFVGR
jgi:hypothetical protein